MIFFNTTSYDPKGLLYFSSIFCHGFPCLNQVGYAM